MTPLQQNARDLEQELSLVCPGAGRTLQALLWPGACCARTCSQLTPPDLRASGSPYARFVQHYQLAFAERTALVLSLVPHIRPQLLDIFFTKNKTFDRKFTEFGGIRAGPDGDFVPTGETLAFILAGNNLRVRFGCRRSLTATIFSPATTSCA